MSTPADTQKGARIALFGGAFDPFHNGHVAAIKHLVRSGLVDRVIVVPSGDRPDKRGVSPALSRYEMAVLGVRESLGDDPRVVVSDVQSSGRVGYATIDLLRYFEGEAGAQLFVAIGDELITDLPHWRDPDLLRRSARFLVFRRPGVVGASPLPERGSGWNLTVLEPFEGGGFDLSSTRLREKLSRGESCEGLMPVAVATYCRERRLYSSCP